jgi:hypothetical protein
MRGLTIAYTALKEGNDLGELLYKEKNLDMAG